MYATTRAVRFSLRIAQLLNRRPEPANHNRRPVKKERFAGGGLLALFGGTLLLTACATQRPIEPDAKYFTISHGTMMFASAMNRASEHCKALGMKARHLQTKETGWLTVSDFECY